MHTICEYCATHTHIEKRDERAQIVHSTHDVLFAIDYISVAFHAICLMC